MTPSACEVVEQGEERRALAGGQLLQCRAADLQQRQASAGVEPGDQRMQAPDLAHQRMVAAAFEQIHQRHRLGPIGAEQQGDRHCAGTEGIMRGIAHHGGQAVGERAAEIHLRRGDRADARHHLLRRDRGDGAGEGGDQRTVLRTLPLDDRLRGVLLSTRE
jgi:hypothetical protein